MGTLLPSYISEQRSNRSKWHMFDFFVYLHLSVLLFPSNIKIHIYEGGKGSSFDQILYVVVWFLLINSQEELCSQKFCGYCFALFFFGFFLFCFVFCCFFFVFYFLSWQPAVKLIMPSDLFSYTELVFVNIVTTSKDFLIPWARTGDRVTRVWLNASKPTHSTNLTSQALT